MELTSQFKAAAWLKASALLVLFMVACGQNGETPPPPPTAPPATLLTIGVSENGEALAQKWSEAYEGETARAAINLVPGNNAALFSDLNGGRLDAILVHHIPVSSGELWFNPVALDGLVIVVHGENPVTSLTQAQVQSLFSGEVGNWSALGLAERAVVPFAQERRDGARTLFARRIMGVRPISINTVIHSDSDALLEAIAAEPGAIGYAMMSAMDEETSRGVKAVAIDGVEANPQNTTSQAYALTVPLYFVASDEPQGELRTFLAWLQSAEGQATVSETVGTVR